MFFDNLIVSVSDTYIQNKMHQFAIKEPLLLNYGGGEGYRKYMYSKIRNRLNSLLIYDLKIAKNKLYIAMIFEKSFLPIDNDILQIICEKFILYDKSI
jgi:hypothetical protein